MRQFLTFILLLISTTLMSSAQGKLSSPDFAFPEKVTSTALKDLDKALSAHDGPLAVEALLRYSIAQTDIDPARITQVASKIDSAIQLTPDTEARAMLHILQARTYFNAYTNDRWAYDERKLPLEPLPADITEWSGQQMAMVIKRNISEALSGYDALVATPIDRYSRAIDADRLTATYYPTLYDFVASQALNMLSSLDGHNYRLSPRWLARRDSFISLDTSTLPGNMPLIMDIYRQLLRAHASDTPAGVMWDTERLNFVVGHLPEDDTREDGFNAYLALAKALGGSEYAAFPLNQLISHKYAASYNADDDTTGLARDLEALRIAQEYVQRHPDFFLTNEIQNSINMQLRKSATVRAYGITAPGYPLAVTVTAINTTRLDLKIYKINKPQLDAVDKQSLSRATVINHIPITLPDRPLVYLDTVVNVTLPDYGNYAIVPEIDGEESDYVRLVAATDLMLGTSSAPGLDMAFVVNPVTGRPVAKATVMSLDNYSKGIRKELGKTDSRGIFDLPSRRGSVHPYPISGADIYSPESYGGYSGSANDGAKFRATVYTALPIYHPGDSIDAAIILAVSDRNGSQPAVNRRIKVELRNPYYNVVTTVGATTDPWGRAQVKLLAPADNSQGEYSVCVVSDESKPQAYGSASVMISDYKMPQVLVTLDQPQVIPGKPVIISGKVTDYTGFPLAESRVTLALSNLPRWRWWYGGGEDESPFFTADATADAAGAFTVTIPVGALDNAPQPDGLFQAKVIATAPSGESQSANASFSRTKQYWIAADVPNAINAARGIDLRAKISDTKGEAQLPLKLTISRDRQTVAIVPLTAGRAVNLSDISSGTYTFTIAPADKGVSAEPLEVTTIVYRDNDRRSPVDQLLWSPSSPTLDADAEGRAVMQVECANDSTTALLILSSPERTLRREWVQLHAGMNTLELQLPSTVEYAHASLLAVRNLGTGTVSMAVRSLKAQNALKLHVTTMRDKVTPGADEQITLTLTNADGSAAQGAVMVDMWNKSLQALAPFSMPAPHFGQSIGWTVNFAGESAYANIYTKLPWLTPTTLSQPLFKYNGVTYRIRGGRMYKSAAPARNMNAMADLNEEEETAVFAEATLAESMVTDSAPMQAGNGEDATTSGTPGSRSDDDANQLYREASTPLSFFRPMLNTDADGRVTLTYTVPNANALWSLNAVAYDRDMLSASTVADIVSAKPVMLQFNAPRFLRMGDEATLRATVMNATDQTQTIVTRAEFYNTSTGETISSADAQRTVATNGSATVSFTVKAPFDGSMIGYRILATAGNYTDGERGMIPLLESVTPVIESDNFYMQPGQITATRDLPSNSIDGQVTLQFCENPAWYVVAALPGLRASTTNTANAASAAIFSAAVADGLLKTNPRIKSMIHRWVTSDKSDSTLVSMLQRNSDLKIALLQATPWMADAASDTERMGRLSLLFDPKEVRAAIDKNIAALAKMQCNGGGWSWTPDYKHPSPWTTMNVLGMLGRLKQLGFLPNDASLSKMIRNALTYIDRETAAQYRRYPNGDYMTYVIIRDYFADIPQSTASAKVTEATVQRIIANWGEMNITDKGIAAIILNNHGYNATARKVISSVREYAVVNPEYGLWWPSLNSRYNGRYSRMASAAILLEAFDDVTPASDDIDLLRQWIVVQKQAQDWDDAVVTTELISSFLGTGTNWTVPPVGVTIDVNGQELKDQSPMAGTGEITTSLTDMLTKTPGTLSITKPGDYPAWGAVITRHRAEMSAVKAAPCQGLSIEKSIYKVVSDASGQSMAPATDVAVGDRVRVDLLIKADNDIDYVVMIDQRGACFEPVEQTPEPIYSQGICFYRENRDATTNLYIDRLPAGTYRLSYDLYVNTAGTYSGGIATIQSQYAPALTAHSAGAIITVR